MRFAARLEQLAAIDAHLQAETLHSGLSRSELYAVQLAVEEACANIIEHAYEGMEGGEIEFTLTDTPEALVVVLRDWGKSFDPQRSRPSIRTLLRRREVHGGLGLHLMRQTMDEVHFVFEPGGANTLTMVKRKKHG